MTSRTQHMLAETAAQLIEEGFGDYHAAKLKAARLLGVSADAGLPSNIEVEAALLARRAIFSTDSTAHAAALETLRQATLDTMRWLVDFSPWVSGPVVRGTASIHDGVQLEIVDVDAKRLEFFLLQEDTPFECEPLRTHATNKKSSALCFRFERHDIDHCLTIFASHAERQRHFSRGSLREERLQLDAAIEKFT